MRNQAWANYVTTNRKSRGMTRRKLAERANIDPSYVTLIERDGYVPRKDKVIDIANAMEIDTDQTLLLAGYAPERIPVKVLLERLEDHKAERVLTKELRDTMTLCFPLTAGEQRKVSEMVQAYVQTLRDTRRVKPRRSA